MRHWNTGGILAVLLLLAGCSPSTRRIGEEPIARYIGSRVATVISGQVINFTDAPSGGGIVIPPGYGLATAVAVADDGYFLTAGHAVQAGPVYLLVNTPAGLHPALARVVWAGPALVESDLAIVHVPLATPAVFTWSPRLVANEVTALSACQQIEEGQHRLEFAEGMVIRSEVYDATGDLPSRELVLHDVPLRQGCSGGPLFDTDGRLLGINIGRTDLPVRRGVSFTVGAALRPDAQWLQYVIDRDRAARRPATRPTTPPP